MGIWVDTDMGFDDLWALLMLQANSFDVDGVSLVSGNTEIDQVVKNAIAANQVFKMGWPLYKGADKPLRKAPQTATNILGANGMRSRGQELPELPSQELPPALPALLNWLRSTSAQHTVLALGPLTNLAALANHHPAAFNKIDRIIWMGGSSGPGNHSPYAEFNALADAEAVAIVLRKAVRIDIVDLQICRKVVFGEHDMPTQLTPLLSDLLGGYLDIALQRNRTAMAIYDPLAALALIDAQSIRFEPYGISVNTSEKDKHGMTEFTRQSRSNCALAVSAATDCASRCLNGLREASELVH
ncbi:MAG: nucleoside hydrolase [Granulosicoccus sp.]